MVPVEKNDQILRVPIRQIFLIFLDLFYLLYGMFKECFLYQVVS